MQPADVVRAQDSRARTPKYKPQPRYTKPQLPDPDSARNVDFNSTTNIRDAVYIDWYAQKMERAKKELKEKKLKEKEAEEKAKKVFNSLNFVSVAFLKIAVWNILLDSKSKGLSTRYMYYSCL